MIFEPGHIYHIYNQVNNRQLIFFNRENYLFFKNKIQAYVLPYADVIAYCLMPNHFHLMVYVRTTSRSTTFNANEMIGTLSSRPAIHLMTSSHRMNLQSLNQAIAVMLRSYTRAINIQENRSGSLFKPHTKAECLTKLNGVAPSFFNTENGTKINFQNPEKQYPQVCFNYIHNNPVKANLVKQPDLWEFSSFKDYCGLRNEKLTNKARATEFGLIS